MFLVIGQSLYQISHQSLSANAVPSVFLALNIDLIIHLQRWSIPLQNSFILRIREKITNSREAQKVSRPNHSIIKKLKMYNYIIFHY